MVNNYTLSNGLRVLLVPTANTRSVTATLAVKVGSRWEDERTNGLAHFAEHLFFKGTTNRPDPLTIATEIESLGAENNAFTSKEFTGFYIKSLSSHLPRTLEILYDLVFNPLFRSEDIDRERGVIIEEIKMYKDSPRDYISTVYFDHIYPNQPLGRDTAGKEETVSRFVQNDFKNYLGKYYVPENIFLCLAGSFEPKMATGLVETYFGQLNSQPGSVSVCPPVRDAFSGPAIKILKKQNEQAHLMLGVPAFAHDHPDRFVASMMATVLGVGMGSRLFAEIREKRSLAYYIHCRRRPFIDTGTIYAGAGIDVTRINEAVKVILEQFKRIAETPVSLSELNRARELVKGRLILGLEETNDLAWFYLTQAMFQTEILSPEEVLTKIDQVTVDDVLRVGKALFNTSSYKLAVIGPYEEGDIDKF